MTFSTFLIGPLVARRGFNILRDRNRETLLRGFVLLLVGSGIAALGFYLFFTAFHIKPSWLEYPFGFKLPEEVARHTIQVQLSVATFFFVVWNIFLLTLRGDDRKKAARNLQAVGSLLLIYLALIFFGDEIASFSLW